ncbi:MAG: CPBP family intramembrane glutamic endopeptidase [Myxococcota bacterium]
MRDNLILLLFPPLLFAVVMAAGSLIVGFGVQGEPEALAEAIPRAIPWFLLINHVLLGAWLMRRIRRAELTALDLGFSNANVAQEVGIGALVAVPLVALNQVVLLPAIEGLGRRFGDYVPSGAVGDALGAGLVPTVIAAVLLAPVIEEALYRGVAWRWLEERSGPAVAIGATSVAFMLLHWAQGFWPMLYTGVAGALFGAVRWWRGSLWAPVVVHLAFNAVELAMLEPVQ